MLRTLAFDIANVPVITEAVDRSLSRRQGPALPLSLKVWASLVGSCDLRPDFNPSLS